MGKRTKRDLEDEQALKADDHPIPARRLERWRGQGLGPASEDPFYRKEHYKLLDQVHGRGRSATWAALVMTGHGFPTAAYRDRISRFWGAFDVDAGSSPLPPFGDADGRSDAERYETADELVGQIMTGIDVEHRTVTDEDENLGDVEHALDAIGPRTIMENLRRGGSENPLGDLSLIIEDAMKRMGGFEPSDPNLAPMPDLAALMAPPGSQPDEATMYKAESMLAHTAPLAPEIAREAREAPLHELGQAAELAYELVLSLDLVAGDDEKARAAGAVLAPGFVAILEVLGPMAVNLLARRGLDTAFEPEATKDPTT